jgi:hypothetical protein
MKLFTSPSAIALLVANLIPIFGVLFWNYDLGNILIIYWAESAVIGLYTLVKMITSTVHEGLSGIPILFIAPFFIVHFGGFMAGHLVFILIIASSGFSSGEVDMSLYQVFYEKTATIHWPLIALVLSHGFSFALNFIGKKEYKKINTGNLSTAPYARIIVMHITIVIGAFATIIFGNSIAFLVLFIFLKIFMDAGAHIREHEKLGSI